MSRSYKKHPVFKTSYKHMKRFANKSVRNFKGPISNGKEYRRVFETCDIYTDYCGRWEFEDFYRRAMNDPYMLNLNVFEDVNDITTLSREEIHKRWKRYCFNK